VNNFLKRLSSGCKNIHFKLLYRPDFLTFKCVCPRVKNHKDFNLSRFTESYQNCNGVKISRSKIDRVEYFPSLVVNRQVQFNRKAWGNALTSSVNRMWTNSAKHDVTKHSHTLETLHYSNFMVTLEYKKSFTKQESLSLRTPTIFHGLSWIFFSGILNVSLTIITLHCNLLTRAWQ
jgi:hypothetical protein